MIRPMLRGALVAAVLLTAACQEDRSASAPPPPQEITEAAIGHYCGMALTDHAGPKGQVLLKSLGEPVWTSSVRDVFAFTMLPEEPKDIAAIYVTDLARVKNWNRPEPGAWVEAREAWYVVDSGRHAEMGGSEMLPFGAEGAARDYAQRHGGKVKRFGEITEAAVFAYAEKPADSAGHAGH
jgi:copper chaperone NosL